MKTVVAHKKIEKRIFLIRGHRVMLGNHLAKLYGVETKALVQTVKRNIKRFPEDFMFALTDEEFRNLKSQIVTSSWGGIRRANPYAFTEQGVAMLSSVLRSKKAIEVNIAIMRVFVKMRDMAALNKEVLYKLNQLEAKIENHDVAIKSIFEAIRQIMAPPQKSKRKIGFH